MAKTRDDFSDQELRKLHEELSKAEDKDARAAIYKRIGAPGQAVGQWFRRMELPPLGTVKAKGTGTKKRGRPAGTKTKTKRGPGRPKGKGASKAKAVKKGKGASKGNGAKGGPSSGTPRGQKPVGRGLGLSKDAKETVIRLLSQLLEG